MILLKQDNKILVFRMKYITNKFQNRIKIKIKIKQFIKKITKNK